MSNQMLLLQVMDFLGSAAFSKAVQALDTKTGMLVCLKIIKVRLHSTKAHLCAQVHTHAPCSMLLLTHCYKPLQVE
jgi:hypothetical protein